MQFSKYYQIIKNNFKQSNILNYAAQLSYGLTLAFLPMLMLFNFTIQFLSRYVSIQNGVIQFISENLPTGIADLIIPALRSTNYNPLSNVNSIISNITLLVFIFYASARLVRSFTLVSSNIMGYKIEKNFIILWLEAIKNLIIILILLIFIIGIYLESKLLVTRLVRNVVNVNFLILGIINTILYFFIFFLLFLLLNWCLAKLPENSVPYKTAFPGTLFTFLGWGLLIFLYKLTSGFFNYEGWVIVVSQGITILIVIYLISLILVTGVLIIRINMEIKARNLNKENKRYD